MGDEQHELLAGARQGVLATIKRSGMPQLSPVTPYYDRAAGTVQVSMTEGRAKTANLRRDPRAALSVESRCKACASAAAVAGQRDRVSNIQTWHGMALAA